MENIFTKKIVKKYSIQGENPNYYLHNFDVPFRALVIAPSGSGKSIFLTNLITLFCKGTEGTFDNIYIFCKSRDEPLYQYLSDKSKGLIDVYENLDKLPPINESNTCKQTLIIFDDFISDLKKHPIISEYFIRGRKKSASIMFLSQSYYNTPKIIRQNINYCVILKSEGTRDINSILRECSIGISKEQLLFVYNKATKK